MEMEVMEKPDQQPDMVLPADYEGYKTSWSTDHELAFLADLGVHGSGPLAVVNHGKSKVELLAGYLEGARRRTDWGKIDGEAVIAKAEKLLKYHQAKESESKNGIR